MQHLLTIKVDTNDGGYRERTHTINDEDVDMITNLFQGLNKGLYGGRIWDVEDYDFEPMRKKYNHLFDDDEFEKLCELIPTCEYGYTRHIESVTITPKTEVTTIV